LIELRATVALLDIEGTVGSIAFVRDVLFPYADARMDEFVALHGGEPDVRAALDLAAREASVDALDLPGILAALHRWSAGDVKTTPLKTIQGMIWRDGFESGAIVGHLYPDAVDALYRFRSNGVQLAIYSSGSVAAQRLLFGHSVAGNLLEMFAGFYDTTTGPKLERGSYTRIAEALGFAPSSVAFFSDNARELDAARDAGMQTVQLVRPEDGTRADPRHTAVATFAGIDVQLGVRPIR
jgi:enolase-phosphatase E1